ncbi:hypothetical protein [Breznakia pachnodae]|uniref:DUF4259 domain-containing protein n=1 Tax=Breznakia pachnodae TaxID=265178 RepID=A0ABU0E687_9FIRM|nr:hypothetical protein [Breznakia pachnodae]MDQ0362015.1 hypothetical protein [Breznakia pachnodae]
MGTWGAGIKDNDTSMEVYEYFFEQYNQGEEPIKIKNDLLVKCKSDLEDVETKYDVLFSLALCLWETQSLDDELFMEIKDIQKNDYDLEVAKAMGADKIFLKQREKAVAKLIEKLSVPRTKAKKRIKPPIQIEGPFKTGDALCFQYPNDDYGIVVVATSEFFKKKGDMRFIYTDYVSKKKPTVEDVLNSHFIGFDWSMNLIGQQGEKYATSNGCAATFSSNQYSYNSANNRERYFDFYTRFFEPVLQLPVYTQVFFNTSWGSWMNTEDMENYHDFELKTKEVLKHCYENNLESKYRGISKETIREFNELLVK